jgi:hypothetical protein
MSIRVTHDYEYEGEEIEIEALVYLPTPSFDYDTPDSNPEVEIMEVRYSKNQKPVSLEMLDAISNDAEILNEIVEALLGNADDAWEDTFDDDYYGF